MFGAALQKFAAITPGSRSISVDHGRVRAERCKGRLVLAGGGAVLELVPGRFDSVLTMVKGLGPASTVPTALQIGPISPH